MEKEVNAVIINRGERTPNANDNQTTKKVKIHDKEDVIFDMVKKEHNAVNDHKHDWNIIQRQLFQDEDPGAMGHLDPRNVFATNESYSVFEAMNDDLPENAAQSVKMQFVPSFKDKLMGTMNASEGDPTAPKRDLHEDLEIEKEDITIMMEGLIPIVSFPQRVNDIMAQCMKYAVVVKILGRFMRQDILYSKIISLWKPTSKFKLTKLDGGCFMVKLSNEADY